jgi:hypothetical protein
MNMNGMGMLRQSSNSCYAFAASFIFASSFHAAFEAAQYIFALSAK